MGPVHIPIKFGSRHCASELKLLMFKSSYLLIEKDKSIRNINNFYLKGKRETGHSWCRSRRLLPRESPSRRRVPDRSF